MQPNKLPIRAIIDRESANGFLFGVLFNQAQKAEKSWEAPYLLGERLKTLDPLEIKELPVWLVADTIAAPPSIHRYATSMAKFLVGTCHVLSEQYDGDARKIWTPAVRSGKLIERLTAFPGIGNHKASVAVFLLTVECGISVIDDGTQINIAHQCPSLMKRYAPFDKPMTVSVDN
jgi:uncharacterized HhH-GPD family protein